MTGSGSSKWAGLRLTAGMVLSYGQPVALGSVEVYG